jgi:hypothetical protein
MSQLPRPASNGARVLAAADGARRSPTRLAHATPPPAPSLHTLHSLADSTHLGLRRRRTVVLSIVLLLVALLLAWRGAAPARADGDPASDVLAEQTVFIPQDGSVPRREQAQLEAIVRTARRSGYPVRVAVIATRSDLGSITSLWLKPATYAGFLGRELSLLYRGALLVVMPDGYGVDLVGEPRAVQALHSAGTSLEGLRLPGHGAALAQAAITGVRRLAATVGDRLAAPTATALPSGPSSQGPGILSWSIFLLGAALIAAAWTVSLRARPWRGRHRAASRRGPEAT